MDTTEENFSWEPKARSRSSRNQVAPRTAGLENPRASISASLLQDLAECQKKAYLRLKKNPERLDPSPFAREKFEDGRRFEALMMKEGRTVALLEQTFNIKITVTEDLSDLGKGLPSSKRAKLHRTFLGGLLEEGVPFLAAQIHIQEVESEEETRGGIADLALWTGDAWILGEIKSTTQPKTHAALQLYHYREIWKGNIPQGEKTSDGIFILHCREGWQFERSSQKREIECIRYAMATTFQIPLAASAYEAAWDQINHLKKVSVAPEGEFCVHCPECPQRLTCYREFAEKADGPAGLSPAFAGFDEAEIQLLREDYGITTVEKALEGLDGIEELHSNNPQIKKELRRRLLQASIFGGYSTWVPPENIGNIIFYSRSPEKEPSRGWKVCGQEPQTTIPSCPDSTVVVAFSQSEMQRARSLINEAQGPSYKIRYVCLQEELEDETLFAYENLSLRGMLRTLEGAHKTSEWSQHVKTNLVPWLKASLTHEEIVDKRERILAVDALWTIMMEIYEGMKPQ